MGKRDRVGTAAAYTVTGVAVLGVLLPLYWLLNNAFKPIEEFFQYPPKLFPTSFELTNFDEALFRYEGLGALRDSAIIAVGATLVTLVLGLPAAYALSRWRPLGENGAYTVLSFRFMPPVIFVVSIYVVANKLGIRDTYALLIAMNTLIILPFTIWLMKGFFDEVPAEIEEAGRVDGATRMQVLRHLVIPLAAPGFVTTAIFAFVFAWNEYLFALLLTESNITPFSKLIPGIQYGHDEPHWTAISAMSVLVILPILCSAFYLYKYIVRGLTYGAVK